MTACRVVPFVHLGCGSVQITSFTVHTSDSRVGAELVDVVLSSLLGQGFALLTSFDGPGLAALPLLADWSAKLDHGGQLLQLLEPGGSLSTTETSVRQSRMDGTRQSADAGN
jgi:hypothetical protein